MFLPKRERKLFWPEKFWPENPRNPEYFTTVTNYKYWIGFTSSSTPFPAQTNQNTATLTPTKKENKTQPSRSKFHFISRFGKEQAGESIHAISSCAEGGSAAMETDVPRLQTAALIQSSRVNSQHTQTRDELCCSAPLGKCNCGAGRRLPHNVALRQIFTWAQYWDLATATSSLRMGWDWDTSGETAWMTAVNLGYGLIPETQRETHSL